MKILGTIYGVNLYLDIDDLPDDKQGVREEIHKRVKDWFKRVGSK